ncbi:MAG: hypothetical protein U0166_24970 [Acidobacteriota bacterium]
MTRARAVATVLGLGALAVVLVRTAWVSDDAYITFRAIDNLRHGYGLRYNVVERVQVFTHPLWMMVMALASMATRDVYVTSMVLGIALSLFSAGYLALRVATSIQGTILALAVLILSKAFVDFSTAGLENALSHALLAVFCGLALDAERPRRLPRIGLVAGLLVLNRLDALLLVAPVLAGEIARARGGRAAAAIARGFVPLVAWLGFATFYYGYPLPNPAYAKLGTGIPGAVLAARGMAYLHNSLRVDPLTLVTIAGAVALAVARRDLRCLLVASGIALHLAYVVRVGGDFMSGRFLTAPLVCAVAVLARVEGSAVVRWVLVAAAAIAGVVAPEPTLLSSRVFGQGQRSYDHGIADERAFYFQGTGLLRAASRGEPDQELAKDGRALRAKRVGLAIRPAVGMVGYFGGPGLYVLDLHAIVDPLLGRLPMMQGAGFRPGHYRRRIPAGYAESVAGENRIADRRLAAYDDRLRLVTRGPLWSAERIAEIWRLNTGRYDALLRAYGEPPRLVVTLDRVPAEPPLRARWDRPGVLPLGHGIDVELPARSHATRLELSIDGTTSYDVVFREGATEVARASIAIPEPPGPEITTRALDVPGAARGYDSIAIDPRTGSDRSALGHIRVD